MSSERNFFNPASVRVSTVSRLGWLKSRCFLFTPSSNSRRKLSLSREKEDSVRGFPPYVNAPSRNCGNCGPISRPYPSSSSSSSFSWSTASSCSSSASSTSSAGSMLASAAPFELPLFSNAEAFFCSFFTFFSSADLTAFSFKDEVATVDI